MNLSIDTLLAYFKQYTDLTTEEIDYIKDHIPVCRYKKGQNLLTHGEVSSEFFFVIKGCVRLFYRTGEDEEEKTAFFYTENQFVSSYESFTKKVPAKHNLQCLEESSLALITHEEALSILQRFPKFEFLARIMMEQELIVYQDIISSFIQLSPEERYLKLLKTQPELLQRIPLYHLATFLGVKPESLSRIRKRIFLN